MYLLMQDEYRISRNARASWYFNHLNKRIVPDPPVRSILLFFSLYYFGCFKFLTTSYTLSGVIRSYFRFYMYKAIRKVLFLPFLMERSYKGLIFGS